jgi:hypothetical protein
MLPKTCRVSHRIANRFSRKVKLMNCGQRVRLVEGMMRMFFRYVVFIEVCRIGSGLTH